MQTIWVYSITFFHMVVVPCVTVPSNWKYCYKVDQWLIPDLIHAWELKTGKYVPYQEEKDYLQNK